MSESFFFNKFTGFWGRRKPTVDARATIDEQSPVAFGLRCLLLFDRTNRDLARGNRQVTGIGQATLETGPYGWQGWTLSTGTSGTNFTPKFSLAPAETASPITWTVSSLVQFNGSGPPVATAAALCGDSDGDIPLVILRSDGLFRTSRAGTDTTFLNGSSSTLSVTTLSGWHRVTVVCNGSSTTLYVDGGETYQGTASVSSSGGLALSSVLGSVRSGTYWSWPTLDFFYWDRPLTASEVAAHNVTPYRVVGARYADHWWVTGQAVQTQAPAIKINGQGNVIADPRVSGLIHVEATFFGSGLFQKPDGRLRPIARTSIAGQTSFSITAAPPPPYIWLAAGAGNATVVGRLRALATQTLAGAGQAIGTASAPLRGAALLGGAGLVTEDAEVFLPYYKAQAFPHGVGTVTANPVKRLAPVAAFAILGNGRLLLQDDLILVRPPSKAYFFGEGRLTARSSVLQAPRVWPVLASALRPKFYTVEIETFVPGVVSTVADKGHGVTPHGALARQIAGYLEKTSLIRASDMGYRSLPNDPQGLIAYPPLLADAFQIDSRMDIDPSKTTAAAAWGSVLISNPDGQLDPIVSEQTSDGRPVTIRTGFKTWDMPRQYLKDPSFGSLANTFIGIAGPWQLSDDGLNIPLRDATYWLERSLQTSLYGGAGGLDGTADLAGKPKPKARGGSISAPIRNVSPVLVDPVRLIYQYTDAFGTVVALYEGAAKDDGNSPGGGIRYAGNVPDLTAGTTLPGEYRTDNARGLFQLGSKAVNQITVDVTGSFNVAGTQTHPFDVLRYMLTEELGVPATSVDSGSFDAAKGLTSGFVGGVWLGADEVISGLDIVDAILTGLGANLVPNSDGTLQLQLLRAVTDTETITHIYDTTNIVSLTPRQMPSTLDPPPYRLRVGYSHNYTVQTSGLNTSLATSDQLQFVASADRYASWVDVSLLSSYRRPNDPVPMPSCLLRQTDAQSIVNSLGTLYGVRRRLYDIAIPNGLFDQDLGDVVSIRYPLEDMGSGVKGRVVGYSRRSTHPTATLTVLV